MKIYLGIAVVAATIGFVGCSQGDEMTSGVNDISMPDGNGSNTLLWSTEGEIYEGTCPAGALPVRVNCEQSIRSSSLDGVVSRATTQLAADQDEQVALHDAEVARLKGADPTVRSMQSQLAALAQQMESIGSDLEILYADATGTEFEIAENEILNEQYAEQLAAISAALADDPDNIELRRLQIALTDEQAIVEAELAYLNTHLETLTAQIATNEAEMSAAAVEHDALSAEFEAFYAGLEVSSTQLDQIESRMAELDRETNAFDSVLAMLADGGIAYRSALLKPAQVQVLARLKSGFAPADARIEQGVLQVRYNDQWRGVCDDYFDRNDAEVACRMMGQSLVSYSKSAWGPNGSFWLDDLSCNGDEDSLFDCGHNGLGSHNCAASEHVALVCQ